MESYNWMCIVYVIIIVTMILLIYLFIYKNNIIKKIFGSGTDDCFKMTLLNNEKYFKFYTDNINKRHYNKIVFNENKLHGYLWFLNLKELRKVIIKENEILLHNIQPKYNQLKQKRDNLMNKNELYVDIKKWLTKNTTTKRKIVLDSFKTEILRKYNNLFTLEQIDKIQSYKKGTELLNYIRQIKNNLKGDNKQNLQKQIKDLNKQILFYERDIQQLENDYINEYAIPNKYISIENNEQYFNAHRYKCAFTELELLNVVCNTLKTLRFTNISIENHKIKNMTIPEKITKTEIVFLNYNYESKESKININVYNKNLNQLQYNLNELINNNQISNPINDDGLIEEYHILKVNENNFMECINQILEAHGIKLFMNHNSIDFETNCPNYEYCIKLKQLLNGEDMTQISVNPDILILM